MRTKEQNRERMRVAREKAKAFIISQKSHPCADCGNSFPSICMDFHHIKDKRFDMSRALAVTSSIKKIQEEIDKCVLLCACCHRIRHKDDLGKELRS